MKTNIKTCANHFFRSLLGGKLVVWSEPEAGTEVELRIPADTAYA